MSAKSGEHLARFREDQARLQERRAKRQSGAKQEQPKDVRERRNGRRRGSGKGSSSRAAPNSSSDTQSLQQNVRDTQNVDAVEVHRERIGVADTWNALDSNTSHNPTASEPDVYAGLRTTTSACVRCGMPLDTQSRAHLHMKQFHHECLACGQTFNSAKQIDVHHIISKPCNRFGESRGPTSPNFDSNEDYAGGEVAVHASSSSPAGHDQNDQDIDCDEFLSTVLAAAIHLDVYKSFGLE